jgi:putative SOS response-associated peptidase YedK
VCGRFTLTSGNAGELAARFGAELMFDGVEYRARYNVAPTDTVWVVQLEEGRRVMRPAHWGLRAVAAGTTKGRLVINVRGETVRGQPTFRQLWKEHRGIVVADGFYEWRMTAEGKRPLWFHRKDGGLLALGAVIEPAATGDPAHLPHAVILTTKPTVEVAPIHDRMPLLVAEGDLDRWLTTPDPSLIHAAPDGTLATREVSARANSVENDDPECLVEAAAVEQLRLL